MFDASDGYRPVWGVDGYGKRRPRRWPFRTVAQAARETGLSQQRLRRLWWARMMNPDYVAASLVRFARVSPGVYRPELALQCPAADGCEILTLEQFEQLSGTRAKRLKRLWLMRWGWALQGVPTDSTPTGDRHVAE